MCYRRRVSAPDYYLNDYMSSTRSLNSHKDMATQDCLSTVSENVILKQDFSSQSRFVARYWMVGAGALGQPRGMVWGGRREEGSGWGTHVCLWWIHFDIWQN